LPSVCCCSRSGFGNTIQADGEKIGWVLAVVFLHFIGATLYFFIGRPKRNTPLTA
jgi:hypothetical protein